MKRKYYLRGLGIGILVTALVFVITKPSELTDDEIIKRAQELGYEKAEEKETTPTLSIKDLMGTGTPAPTQVVMLTETPAPTKIPTPTEEPVETQAPTEPPVLTEIPQESVTPEPTATEIPTEVPTPEPTATVTPTPTPTKKPTSTPTIAPTKAPRPTKAPEPSATPAPTGEPEGEVIIATISVERGNTAKAVCDKIEKAGIVEDGDDLKNYIVRNQLADFINVGTYTLSSDMSYEEIAEILTER